MGQSATGMPSVCGPAMQTFGQSTDVFCRVYGHRAVGEETRVDQLIIERTLYAKRCHFPKSRKTMLELSDYLYTIAMHLLLDTDHCLGAGLPIPAD